MKADPNAKHRCGYVAIVGLPNVGKSTLLNRIIGSKLAIVTPKPQTTRRNLLGIKSVAGAQLLFLDTPGLHKARDLINRHMVRYARAAIEEADVVLVVVDAGADLKKSIVGIANLGCGDKPLVIAVNKVDAVGRIALIPLLEPIQARFPEADVVPISAVTGDNVKTLVKVLAGKLPEAPRLFDADDITNESERNIVAEIIREKVMLQTEEEVPYGAGVTIDSFEERPGGRLVVIQATIHMARESHKPILVGEHGSRIKAIGQAARSDIEKLLHRKVFLELFVRVQTGWTKDESHLKEFGL